MSYVVVSEDFSAGVAALASLAVLYLVYKMYSAASSTTKSSSGFSPFTYQMKHGGLSTWSRGMYAAKNPKLSPY